MKDLSRRLIALMQLYRIVCISPVIPKNNYFTRLFASFEGLNRKPANASDQLRR